MGILDDKNLTNILYAHCLKCRYTKAAKEIARSFYVELPGPLLWLSSLLILPDSEDVEAFVAFLDAFNEMRKDFDSPELNEELSAFVDFSKRFVLHLMLEQNSEISGIVSATYRYFPKSGPFLFPSPSGGIQINTVEDENRAIRRKVLSVCLEPKLRGTYLDEVWRPNKRAARAKLEDLAKAVSKALPTSIFDMMFFESEDLQSFFERQPTDFSLHIAQALSGKQWLYEEDVQSIVHYLPLTLNDSVSV